MKRLFVCTVLGLSSLFTALGETAHGQVGPPRAGTGAGTGQGIAAAKEEMRTYDVLPLVRPNPDRTGSIEIHGSLIFAPRRDRNPFDNFHFTRDVVKEFNSRSPKVPAEELIDLLAGTLEILFAREDYGNKLHLERGGVLRASLTSDEHLAASHLITSLESVTGSLIEVECLLVPPALLGELRGRAGAGRQPKNEIFDRALLDPRSRLLSVTTENGRWGNSGSTTRSMQHDDFEVNQTGVIPVLMPVVNARRTGDALEVYPLTLGQSGEVYVHLAVGRYAVDARKTSFGGPWGELDTPVQNEVLLSTTLVARPGQVTVAGELNTTDGFVALVRVRTAEKSTPTPAVRAADRIFRVYDTAPLFTVLRRSFSDGGDDYDHWELDDVRERLDRHFDARVDDIDNELFALEQIGEALAVIATERFHTWVTGLVERELAKLARSARVDLEFLTVPRTVFAQLQTHREGLNLLKAGWAIALEGKDGVARKSFSAVGVTGQVHGLRDVAWETLLTGVEQVSGGTGFAIIEVADPVVQRGGSGIQLSIQTDFTADGSHAYLSLSGQRAKLLESRTVVTSYPVVKVASGETASTAVQDVSLSLPRQKSLRWDIRRKLPTGRWSILSSDAETRGQVELLVGRVRSE